MVRPAPRPGPPMSDSNSSDSVLAMVPASSRQAVISCEGDQLSSTVVSRLAMMLSELPSISALVE